MRNLFTRPMRLHRLPLWLRYSATVLLVLVAFGVRYHFTGVLTGYPFLLFLPAILISAVLFDQGSGILASVLSTVLAAYFIEPEFSFHVAAAADLVAMALFLAISLTMALIIEALHTAVHDLAAAHDELAASERDKDVLLGDLSHRLQNDVHMMMSLLQMESRSITDLGSARLALAMFSERLQILGRVHHRLTRRKHQGMVETHQFLSEVCEHFRASFVGSRPIGFHIDIENRVLTSDRALIVGLVLNELLTNALKYAFPADRAGNISIQFHLSGEVFVLSVIDDGVGIQEPRRGGQGRRILDAFAAQLDGSIEWLPRNPGTACTLRFPAVELQPEGGTAIQPVPKRQTTSEPLESQSSFSRTEPKSLVEEVEVLTRPSALENASSPP
jgi:two-component system, sensor histidine kinase PdtaS